MKIITKYKDYYDYLQGIYGVDEKLVLDRRSNDLIPYTPSTGKLTFYIAGYIIEGLWLEDEKKCLFGNNLLKYTLEESTLRYSKHENRDYTKSIIVEKDLDWHSSGWYYIEPIIDLHLTNEKNNCPILLKSWSDKDLFLKYPKLIDFNFPSFIDATNMYLMLQEWLSNQITKKEQISEVDNKLKIVNKGFDLKSSFRPKMK